MSARHATLVTRKALFARSAVLRAFRGVDELIGATADAQAALQARDELLRRFSHEARRPLDTGAPNDAEQLDAYAGRLSEIVDYELILSRKRGYDELTARLERTREELLAINCIACALGRPPCGPAEHHDIVTLGGECIAEIKAVFQFALGLGTSLYDDAWGGVAQRPSTRVSFLFNTDSVTFRPPQQNKANLEARTFFGAFAPIHESSVNLLLDGNHFGNVERDAIPYLLVHEVVAHGFYAVACGEGRTARDPHDFWSEGWMDCVALDTLVAALEHPLEWTRLNAPNYLRGERAIVDAAEACHVQRYAPVHQDDSCLGNGLRQARARYHNLAARIRQQYPVAGYDPMRPVHLACAILNAYGAPADAIAALNSRASTFTYSARQGLPFTDLEEQFYQALVRFVGHHDPEQLVADLQ